MDKLIIKIAKVCKYVIVHIDDIVNFRVIVKEMQIFYILRV